MSERNIFIAALQRSNVAERSAFLDEACSGNAELREQVETLLREHDQLGSFLEPPAREPAAGMDDPIAESAGTVIGPYKLLEQIGEGGFGVVFMAEQQHPLRRKVALKVVKPGMDSRQVIARFEAERQALALMDHPNIAHVLDAGETPDSRPYFVMELVRGFHITDYCDQNSLTPRARLELFVPVCQAVQHAHQKGIIHRDIKPSNVLVTLHDGTPVVKLVDFGIAKATGRQLTDKTLFTGFAQLIGSPLYMSPEQAEMSGLDIDTRTDIYALGVLLYELLTGTTPFDKDRLHQLGFDQLRRIIREEEPPKPSTRISTLGQASTTISAQRQSDPKRLSHLLRGELDWIVMKALEKDRNRRYDTAGSFAADVQRHLHDDPVQACPQSTWYRLRKFSRRNKRALAVAACIFCMAAVLAGSFGWITRDKAARLAELDRDREARRATTERLADDTLQQAALLLAHRKWPEALAAVKRAEGLLTGGGGSQEVHERVDQMLADLKMAVRLEEILLQKTAVKDDRFDFALADLEYAKAFREYDIDVNELDAAAAAKRIQARSIPVELAVALDDWAMVRKVVRKKNDLTWKHLLAVARLADGDPWRNQLRQALGKTDRKTLQDLAGSAALADLPPVTLCRLATSLKGAGAVNDALVLLRRAQEQHPGDFWVNHDLAYCLSHMQPPQWDEALRFFTVAAALRPQSPGVQVNLASALNAKGLNDEAIAAYRRAIALKPDYAAAHHTLGAVLHSQGKLDAAVVAFNEAIRLQPNNAITRYNLGVALQGQGKLDAAIAAYQEATRLQPDYAEAYFNLGTARQGKGELDAAITAYQEVIRLRPQDARAYCNLGSAREAKGELDAAIAAFREAIRLQPDSLQIYNLGTALLKKGQPEAATAAIREAIRLQPGSALAHYNLGLALAGKEELEAAIAAFKEAIHLDPDYAAAHYNLGAVLGRNGQLDAAIAAYREAIRRQPDHAQAYCNLGQALRRKGQFADALAALRRGHELGSKDPRWPHPSPRWVRECERLVLLDGQLPLFLKGDRASPGAAECIELAQLCTLKRLHGATARFYVEAFAAKPELAEDRTAGHRHAAARAAARAGCGESEDAGTLADRDRARWRKQALAWLQADLRSWTKELESKTPQDRVKARQALQNWQRDPSLAGLRDEPAPAKLPEAERAAWRKLWVDVDALVKRAAQHDRPRG